MQVPTKTEAKKVYEQPKIVYQAPLEAVAGVCGTRPNAKTDQPGDCTNPATINS